MSTLPETEKKCKEEDKSLGENVDRTKILQPKGSIVFQSVTGPQLAMEAESSKDHYLSNPDSDSEDDIQKKPQTPSIKKNKEEEKSLSTVILPAKGSSQRGIWSGPFVKQSASDPWEDDWAQYEGADLSFRDSGVHTWSDDIKYLAMKGNEEDKSLDRRAIYHAVPFKQGPRPDPKEFLSARVKKNKEEEKSLSTVILPAKGSSQRGIWSGPFVKQSASGAEDHFQTKPGKTPFYLCAAAHSYPPNFNPYSMSSSLWTSSWRTCEFCSVFVDHEHWQPFEPTRVTAVDETVKYRISVTRGSHECRVTGLRWQSFCNVELEYSLGDWDLYSDLLEKKGFVPCGPLMDLRVISGQLAAVHLPHFICLDTQHRWRDFRMLCAEDTGVSLEDCLISQFHAVQFCHTFIPMGVLVSSGVPVKAHCDILIYLSSTAHQTLHVYLIPGDVKMKESVEKREKGSVKICTWPDVSLQMKQHYTLSTSCSSQITPQKLKLRYTSKTPNFFKVNIKEVTKHSIDLQLLSEKKTVVRQAYIQSDIIQGPAVSESSPAVLKRSKGYETPVVKIKEKSEARSERAADQKKVMEASEQFGKWWKSSCRSCSSVQDTAEWKHIEPEADENLHYRVSSSAGRYECSVSGLRWVTEGDVSLKYHFADWKPHSEDLRRMQFEPCGPLMDITVISGRIVEVHLPHFACLGSSPALTDVVRVLDVQDDGMFLEKCELTCFHAKLLHPTFSPKGFLIRSGFPVKVHCEVLIYQTLTSLLTLHVYLVTCDLNSIQEVEKKEKDAVKILKPGPERSLPMKSWYNIETKFKSENFSSTIKPKRLKLRYSPIKYCEVYTKNPDDDFELHLINERKESIWDGVIRTDEYRRSSSFTSNDRQSGPSTEYAVWFVTTHRNALIKGVSLVNPIADDLNEVIGEEKYSIITECKTPQKQMRKIYSFLCGGQEIKRKFYESLLRHEPHLVADLTGAD